MTGTIDQSACRPGYSSNESVEVMPRDGIVVRPSDNERGCYNLSEPGPAVEREKSPHRTAHGGAAIGGQHGTQPGGLIA